MCRSLSGDAPCLKTRDYLSQNARFRTLPAADAQAIRQHLLRFASQSEEGRLFFEKTGFSALREPAPGLMESMDPYVSATRRMLMPSG